MLHLTFVLQMCVKLCMSTILHRNNDNNIHRFGIGDYVIIIYFIIINPELDRQEKIKT